MLLEGCRPTAPGALGPAHESGPRGFLRRRPRGGPRDRIL